MATVKINGMRCAHCSGSVTKALEGIDGISNVKVDLEKGEATYAENRAVPLTSIKEAISKIGFEVAD
ncbi:MAG: heavy-metal-associated domain-containing protein [Proteobacteria bacterium]|nr:heavy-metal-associated domain-containing protein [Pseudomonadota bacterium]MBU4295631.1 heavy-metal-associated domain-containing protein [Pseudomonadota bacterium]MCG2746822.1 heavy-metal-associated domain-containing protein [Desulfobulbaceae bacterium]